MYQHILLPTDGSELSGQAIRSGIQLAKSIGARVTGLYVIEESHVAAGIGKSLRKEEEPLETAKTFLAAITSAAKAAGVPCQCFRVTGEAAADQIVRTAAEKGCDLIYMASHGRERLTGALLGNVTVAVLNHSRTPVLVYR